MPDLPPTTPASKAASSFSADAVYQSMKTLSDGMRDAALCGQWDRCIALGQQYVEAFGKLSQIKSEQTLSESVRKHRAKLLIEILDNDVLIRELAAPEMAKVSATLSRVSKNRAAIRAYYEQYIAPAQT